MNKKFGLIFSIVILLGSIATFFLVGQPHDSTAQTRHPSATSVVPPTRGYLTTPAELAELKALADAETEPFASTVQTLLEFSGEPDEWKYGSVSGEFYSSSDNCKNRGNDKGDEFLAAAEGAHEVYRKMLVYYLTDDIRYAEDAREKILDLTNTTNYEGVKLSGDNQCILALSFAIPVWIQSADLLGGTSIWSAEDKRLFQDWLANEVYFKVAWASRTRINNWGSAGSLSAAMLADYLWDWDGLLIEVAPQRRALTPRTAYTEHNALQLARVNGTQQMDSDCPIWGIQPYGGIPDELRRGSTDCDGKFIEDDDKALSYTTLHIEHLVFHAEFLLRRGDSSLYENPHLLQSILFVLDNPEQSWDWVDTRKGTLWVANSYYQDERLAESAAKLDTLKGGTTLPYGSLTHSLTPMHRPIVSPP